VKKYILALDEGTTSARSILFDHTGSIIAVSQKEFPQYYPESGWVEQDANEIWAAQSETMLAVVRESGIQPSEIAAIGITNQRETVVVWEKDTGKPICPAIVWQCRRTADICEEWKKAGLTDAIRDKTGLVVDAYFSGSKLKWILENVDNAMELARDGKLLCGTVDSWLIWKLTGGRCHMTDVTNASRTMLFNIRTMEWDDELLALCSVPRSMLPQVKASSSCYGTVRMWDESIPICGVCGDQQAALFGQGCFCEGSAKNTYGTGCFLLMHTGNRPIIGKSGLLATVAAGEEGKAPEYALEGSVFVGGAVIQWLRDELGLISSAAQSEEIASALTDTDGVYVVPAFTGLGAPYWNMYARGTIVGLTRGQSRERLIRAALESIAYQTADVLSLMEEQTGRHISHLRADGGASRNRLLMQFQADISARPVELAQSEATAMGAAFLAGLGSGFWKNRDELSELIHVSRQHFPSMNEEKRSELLDGWHRAVRAAELYGNVTNTEKHSN